MANILNIESFKIVEIKLEHTVLTEMSYHSTHFIELVCVNSSTVMTGYNILNFVVENPLGIGVKGNLCGLIGRRRDKGEVTAINGGISIRGPATTSRAHSLGRRPAHPRPLPVHPCNKLGHSFCLVRSSARRNALNFL